MSPPRVPPSVSEKGTRDGESPVPTSETVGVLSDTHLDEASPALVGACERLFVGCSRILHAGDVIEAAVLESLGPRFLVEAVRGNMDFSPTLAHLPRHRIVQVGGLSIGLAHGAGPSSGLEERILDLFGDAPPRVIVHGHSHVAADRVVGGVRFLNPGSATDPRAAPFRSAARLTVSGLAVTFEILRLPG